MSGFHLFSVYGEDMNATRVFGTFAGSKQSHQGIARYVEESRFESVVLRQHPLRKS